MKVYVVLNVDDQYGRGEVKAVFTTKEKARTYCKGDYHLVVKECELDPEPAG